MKHLLFFLFFSTSIFSIIAQPSRFEVRGIGGGGALFSPAISPFDNKKIWMACDMTELFFTENGGASWDFYDFRDFVSHTHSPVNFTSHPDVLYALRMSFRDGIVHPVKSTDGGDTWQNLLNPQPDGLIYLFADPARTDRVLVTDWSNLYFSNNSGQSWQAKYDDNAGNFYVAGVFWDGQDIFVGTNYGLLVSHNGGQTFAIESVPGITADAAMASFAGAKEAGKRVFYAVTADKGDIYPTVPAYDYTYGYDNVYRLNYGEATSWTKIGNGFSANLKLLKVASSGTDADVVYVAGTNIDNSFPIIYKSPDRGGTWAEVFKTQNNRNIATGYCGFNGDENWWYAEAPIGFAVQHGNADVAVITDFGFAHKTTDGGVTWQQLYVQPSTENPPGFATPRNRAYRGNGLENTSSWWLTWTDASTIFASYSDIGAMTSPDGGRSWSFDKVNRDMNSTYQFLKHPTQNILYAATSSVHDMYQSTYLTDARIDNGKGQVLFSKNGGMSWEVLHDFGHPVVGIAIDEAHSWMYASVVHSTEGGIYKTENLNAGAASEWTKLPNPPRTEGHPYRIEVLNDGTVLCSFSGRRAPNFTPSSGVFWGISGGNIWQDRSHPDMHYWTKDVVVDPHDRSQNTWYASVFSGWGGAANDKGGLFKTIDRGRTWWKISNLFRVESCAVDPENSSALYVTTEDEGLWYRNTSDLINPNFRQLPGYKFQHPVRVFFNPYKKGEVWVTSFGNGQSVGTFTTDTDDFEQIAENWSVSPNPASDRLWLKIENPFPGDLNFQISDLTGRILESWKQQSPLSGKVELGISHLPKGVYFLKTSDGKTARALRFVKG